MGNVQCAQLERVGKMNLKDFIASAEQAVKDEFIATVGSDESGLTVRFVGGQTFRLTVSEVM